MTKTIPQYIRDAIKRRTESAYKYFTYDRIISEWCEKNNVDTEFINGHVETISNFNSNFFIQDIEECLKNLNKNDILLRYKLKRGI